MNEQRMNKKIQRDSEKVKRNLNTLMEDGVEQVTRGWDNLKNDARVTLVDAADTVKKEVGQGLNQFNTKAQEYADRVPGGLGEKAIKYPWVAISIGLGIGLILGGLLKPTRQS